MGKEENIREKGNETGKVNDSADDKQDSKQAQTGHSQADKKKKDKKDKASEQALSQLQAKYDELNDKYLRLYSEFDNYRKRTLREKTELNKTAAEDIILSLLPVMDDMERALKATIKSQDGTEIIPRAGIDLIYQKFKSLLVQKGLEPIPAAGEVFNVDFHDALTNIPVEDEAMKGKVVDEIERGYKLNGKVIRYAKVVVGS